MPYSELLADRIRAVLAERHDVIEKKMFGGIAFMVAGSMACGIKACKGGSTKPSTLRSR